MTIDRFNRYFFDDHAKKKGGDAVSHNDVTEHRSLLTRLDRERLNGHRSCVLWFTGLSGSGKSTLAYALEKELYSLGCRSYVLDGDNVRRGLNRNLGFGAEDRKENIRRVAETAKLFADAGMIVAAALISPYRADREAARRMFAPNEYIEIYVDCPIDVCARRDPKGLYRKAIAGGIPEFTGITAPYEPPLRPELVIRSADEPTSRSVERIIDYLTTRLDLFRVSASTLGTDRVENGGSQ